MGITLFLLGLLYVAFVVALIFLLKSWVLVVVVAAALLGAQYWFSDRVALFAMRGRVVEREEYPELHGVVDRLCAIADMPKPVVAVSEMDMPNAFATGRNPDHAVVCVTTGLLRRLRPDELEGVLAHELSHVAHKDVAVITVASFLGVIAGLIVRFAFYSQLFSDGRRDQNTAAIFAVVMGVSAAVYALSFLLIRALSRYRELAADRAAALLTGRPSALASALTKVSGDIARIPTKDLRTAQAFNAFYFTPALGREPGIARIFSTHPSLEQRLDQLGRISAELGEAAAPGGREHGAAGHSAGPHETGRARSRPALRAAVGGDHAGGGGRVPAHRERRGVLRHGRGRGLRADAPRGTGAARRGRRARGPACAADAGRLRLLVAGLPAQSRAVAGAGQRPARGEQRDGGQRLRPAAAVLAGGIRVRGGEEPDAGDRSDGSDEAERGEPRRRLALVYLYKRGTFYPFAPLPDTTEHRDNPLELRVRAALANDLRIEQDLNRWFPLWGAPGL